MTEQAPSSPTESVRAFSASPVQLLGHRNAVPGLLREINELVIYEAIRSDGPISRADLARTTGRSKPTVSLAVRSLVDAGLINEVGIQTGRPGRSGVLFSNRGDGGSAIGVDIGGRYLRAACCDLDGNVTARIDRALAADSSLVDQVTALITAVITKHADDTGQNTRPDAVAIGSPGVVDPITGTLSMVGVLHELVGIDLGRVLSDRLDTVVIVENDVNLATLGEQAIGAAHEVANVAVISVGTGLGSGLILHGELHRGARGAAGEIDFIPFRELSADTGQIDPSTSGLLDHAQRIGRNRSSGLAEVVDTRTLFDLAAAGDVDARDVIDDAARWIAYYAASIVAVVDVSRVVLAGGIGSHPLLLEPVATHLAALLPHPPEVVQSQLGDSAVLCGALAVGRAASVEAIFSHQRNSREEARAR